MPKNTINCTYYNNKNENYDEIKGTTKTKDELRIGIETSQIGQQLCEKK